MARPKDTNRYTTETCLEKALEIIQNDPNVVFMVDIFPQMALCQKTFYTYIKPDSPEMKQILEELDKNRIALKSKIRNKLLDMNNPTAMIVLYKLIGDKDERAALSNNHKGSTEEPINANIELKFT
jgi:hypothetical protein